jgi:hypothetical protein
MRGAPQRALPAQAALAGRARGAGASAARPLPPARRPAPLAARRRLAPVASYDASAPGAPGGAAASPSASAPPSVSKCALSHALTRGATRAPRHVPRQRALLRAPDDNALAARWRCSKRWSGCCATRRRAPPRAAPAAGRSWSAPGCSGPSTARRREASSTSAAAPSPAPHPSSPYVHGTHASLLFYFLPADVAFPAGTTVPAVPRDALRQERPRHHRHALRDAVRPPARRRRSAVHLRPRISCARAAPAAGPAHLGHG